MKTEQKISLITWIYVWGFFLSLEAAGLTEAGPAPAASGMLKNKNNKPVFSAATGLVGCKLVSLLLSLSTFLHSAENHLFPCN